MQQKTTQKRNWNDNVPKSARKESQKRGPRAALLICLAFFAPLVANGLKMVANGGQNNADGGQNGANGGQHYFILDPIQHKYINENVTSCGKEG